jgi:hypothetical protein
MARKRFQVEVDLSASQASAVKALGDRSVADALPRLAAVATREWLEWLVADDRPASLTEVSKRRVKGLVDEGLLPPIPTAPVIAQRTRLTLGQARYIVSSLALEDPAGTAAVREGLIGRLREAIESARIQEPDELEETEIQALAVSEDEIVFDVPRAEADLAAATHEELLNARFSSSQKLEIDTFPPPTRKRRTDSYVQLDMRPHVAVQILQHLIKVSAE